jgi:hypothetical protein
VKCIKKKKGEKGVSRDPRARWAKRFVASVVVVIMNDNLLNKEHENPWLPRISKVFVVVIMNNIKEHLYPWLPRGP